MDHDKKRWLRSWRLLRWLLFPMLLLHLFFTPGEIIFSGYSLPLSYEGLQRGLWLALHFSEIFYAALLLGYLMPISIWMHILIRFEQLQPILLPYVYLMPKMMLGIRALIRREYKAWQLKGKRIATLANHISNLVSKVESYSNRKAKYMWHSWDSIVLSQYSVENIHQSDWASKGDEESLSNGMLCMLMLPLILELGFRYL